MKIKLISALKFNWRGEVYPEYTLLKRISWRPTEYFEPASGLNQKARVLDDTNFALDIETDKGCTAVDRVQVKINKAKIYIPNIIQSGSNQNAFLTVYGGTEVQEVALCAYLIDGAPCFLSD